MQRSSAELKPESLLDFNPTVRSLLRGAKASFKKEAEEINDLDTAVGRLTVTAYKEAPKGMWDLINQEKGAQMGDASQQALSREQVELKRQHAEKIQEVILLNTVDMLKAKLMEKVDESKFAGDGDAALQHYIQFLNKNSKKDPVGRLVALVLNYIYENQRNLLIESGHVFMTEVAELRLAPKQKDQYGFKKMLADREEVVKENEEEFERRRAREERKGEKEAKNNKIVRTGSSGDLRLTQSGRFLSKIGRIEKDSSDSLEVTTPRTAERKVLSRSFKNLSDFFGHKSEEGVPLEEGNDHKMKKKGGK